MKKTKISKKRIQEIVKEELYSVLKEFGIPDLTPKSFNDAIKSATKGQEAPPEKSPDLEVTTPTELRRKWLNYSKNELPDITNKEAELVSGIEDDILRAAEEENIVTGPIKSKIDQLRDVVGKIVDDKPEMDPEYEL